jgi:hypothetical protein
MREDAGQATAEYVGLLALAAVVFAGVGATVGLGAVGEAVADGVRTGICIVGGDICRSSDAAAAGLEPCTVGERSEGGGTTIAVGWLRLGGGDGWTVAQRSDGSVLVTKTHDRMAGAGAGIGIEASPLGLSFGLDGKVDFTMTSGATWEFPDAAAAGRFLAGDDRERRPPTWRFGEAGEVLNGEAAARVGGATLTGVEATARGAGGVRVGRGQTTVYVRTRLDTGGRVWMPGRDARFEGPSTGDIMVELTFEGDHPRELGFRSVRRAGGGDRVVDTVARLDLRDPANRRAAARVLAERPPWGPGVLGDLRALRLLAVQRGVVERAVYDVRDDSGSFELAVKLGVELGVEADEVKVVRRLVAASAWTPGTSQERLREDCVA